MVGRARHPVRWEEGCPFTKVERGAERHPLFQVALLRTYNWFEAKETEWLNLYAEWQAELADGGPGVYTFWDRDWHYEVKILTPLEINAWDLPYGWEPFAYEELIVGWQRNVTMSPERWRPVRRIDRPVINYYQANLPEWAYDAYRDLMHAQSAHILRAKGKRKRT